MGNSRIRMQNGIKRRPALWHWCLVVTILFAGSLRFIGLDWDEGRHLHPDERFLTMVEVALQWPTAAGGYFDESKSTLNPRNVGFDFFAYGTFPLFLVKAVSLQTGMSDYDQVYLVGRFLSGFFDVGTVVLLFLFGWRLYEDRRVGLLAAAFYSVAVLPIQHSHFFVVDSFSTFFTLACLHSTLQIQRYGRIRDWVVSGLFFGLALACKVSVFLLAPLVIVVTLVHYWASRRNGERLTLSSLLEPSLSRVVLFFLVAFLIFRIFQPYAFEGPGFFGMFPSERWLDNLREVRALVSGDVDFPPGHQWTDRAPLWFPMKNLVLWGVGIPLGIIAWLGWGFGVVRLLRDRELAHLVPILWIGGFFLYQGTQWVKAMRYLLPIYPMLALMAAWFLIWVMDWSKIRKQGDNGNLLRRAAIALTIVTLLSTGLWAISFTGIYSRTHTRIAASLWIYENLESGKTIANEHWDDALPLPAPGFDPGSYPRVEMRWYDPDTKDKLKDAQDWLQRADYIVLSSNRLYESIPRLPRRYPMTTRFYRSLFDGSLGWDKIAEFNSFPNLFSISIPDTSAEEAFSVYDHPRVLIFGKVEGYDSERTRELLGRELESRIEMSPRQATKTRHGLMLPPERWESQQAGGTWSSLFDPASLPNRYPVAAWLIVVEILGLLCFPILLPFTNNLTDKGYSLAKLGGLLLFGWLAWYVSSLQILEFSRALLVGCFVVISLAGGVFAWRYRTRLRALWDSHRSVVLTEEALFLTLFLLFVLIRAANPDLWHPWRGGEKPMDFSYLNAVVKSVSFPPYDPWFTGGYINYYYFGFVLYGAIIKLTGIVPEVGYNLAIPTIFALTGLGTFGVVLNLLRPAAGSSRIRAMGFGLLGTYFAVIAGNLGLGKLLLERLSQVSSLEFESTIPWLQTVTKAVHGLYLTVIEGVGLSGSLDSWYWSSSRLISHPPDEPAPITEFPFFTSLFADLHAHAMAMPVTLFCLGLSVCVLIWKSDKLSGQEPLWRTPVNGKGFSLVPGATLIQWASFGWLILWLGLALGGLWATNTWDVPVYSLVILVVILISFAQKGRGFGSAGLAFGSVLLAATILFAPFHYWYASPVGGIRWWDGSNTPLIDFFAVFGVYLFLTITLLWKVLSRPHRPPPQIRIILGAINAFPRIKRYRRVRSRLAGFGALQSLLLWLTVSGILVVLALILSDHWVAGSSLLLCILACLLLNQSSLDAPLRLIMALIAIGFLAAAAVEVLVVEGDVGRMNTVFKSYLQIWILWSVASAFAAAKLWERRQRSTLAGKVWLGVLLALILVASAYPVAGTFARVQDRFAGVEGWSLNGALFMDSAEFEVGGNVLPLHSDREAIKWLRKNVAGSPVVAEANTHPALYQWGNRITMFTGLPSIVGWGWHQRQQRGQVPGGLVERRINDVQRLFNTTDLAEAKELLSRYEVKWIVVGSLEKALYDSAGLGKFPLHEGIHWRRAYRSGELAIYEVLD